jgi:hypothetical protein
MTFLLPIRAVSPRSKAFIRCALALLVALPVRESLSGPLCSGSYADQVSGKVVCTPIRQDGTRCQQAADDLGPGFTVVRIQDRAQGLWIFQVDRATFNGWLIYRAFCFVCHTDEGTGGPAGSANLKECFRATPPALNLFEQTVHSGVPPRMPPWSDNAIVRSHYKDLFAYLRAFANNMFFDPTSPLYDARTPNATGDPILRMVPVGASRNQPEERSKRKRKPAS